MTYRYQNTKERNLLRMGMDMAHTLLGGNAQTQRHHDAVLLLEKLKGTILADFIHAIVDKAAPRYLEAHRAHMAAAKKKRAAAKQAATRRAEAWALADVFLSRWTVGQVPFVMDEGVALTAMDIPRYNAIEVTTSAGGEVSEFPLKRVTDDRYAYQSKATSHARFVLPAEVAAVRPDSLQRLAAVALALAYRDMGAKGRARVLRKLWPTLLS